jgi:hypothetical protein
MFGFIKNWFKPKDFKEVKKEYKTLKSKAEDLKERLNEYRASEIEGEILDSCYGGLRPDQEECPPLIIYNFKKLLEIANEESLVRATNYLGMFLTEQQQQDFMNKVSQLKEYKEWKLKNRINKLNEDF